MRTLRLVPVLLLAACGGPTSKPDAGPDTSCGLDCAAQARFGLIVNRCFEYSSETLNTQDPPALGAWVKDVFTLEGGIKVLPVEYRQNGQIRMIDSFGIVDGQLRLMRREFSNTSQSVTYRDDANTIVGARWFPLDVGAGQTYEDTPQAFVVGGSGVGTTEATSFKVTTVAGTTSQLRTPLEPYADGMQLIFSETPNHGSDSQRVFVPDVGFILIASDFSLTQGSPTPLRLQRIRDIGTPDAGTADCSLGAP
jgi:hypothetical protein